MGRHGGASNAAQNEVCPYCGGLLKISDGNKKFVSSQRAEFKHFLIAGVESKKQSGEHSKKD